MISTAIEKNYNFLSLFYAFRSIKIRTEVSLRYTRKNRKVIDPFSIYINWYYLYKDSISVNYNVKNLYFELIGLDGTLYYWRMKITRSMTCPICIILGYLNLADKLLGCNQEVLNGLFLHTEGSVGLHDTSLNINKLKPNVRISSHTGCPNKHGNWETISKSSL